MIRRAFEWLMRHGWLALVAALVVVAGTLIFLTLADRVRDGTTREFDEWVLSTIAQYRDHEGGDWLTEGMRDATALGGVLFLSLMTTAVAGYLLICRKYGAMTLVLVAVLGGFLLSLGLKQTIARDRPMVIEHRSHVATASFPSGHSMLSAVVYLTLGSLLARIEQNRFLKWYFLLVALILTFMVGVSRIYLGVHWPTDVLAGWSAGLAWALLCWLVARSLQKRGTVEQLE